MTEIISLELDDERVELEMIAARARRRIEDLPGLVGYIRGLVVPSLGGAKDGMPRGSRAEAPVPARLDAVDDSDAVWRQLVEWVDYWAGIFDVKPPSAATAAWRNNDGELLGFRPHLEPYQAQALTKYLTDWLLVRHEAIIDKQSGRLYFDDVSDLQTVDHDQQTRSSIWGKYPRSPRRPRPVVARPCPVCDEYAFGAEWPDGGKPEDVTLRCDHCGYVVADPLADDREARQVIRLLREERQSWDRPSVLAFYDEHGFYPTQDPADPQVWVRCDATTVADGVLLHCELGGTYDGHTGRHETHRPDGTLLRWSQPRDRNKGGSA
jgi:hypothetical protein